MLLDVVLLAAAVRRIHQYDVKLVVVGIVEHILCQRVVVHHLGRVDVVEQHIGDAEHIGELLFLDAIDRLGVFLFVLRRVHLLVERFQPARDEAAGAAGKVGHLLSDLWTDDFCHEIGEGTRGVELAGRTGRLHLFEDRLVDLAKSMALLIVAKVELVDDIDDLTQQDTILHILVGILKSGSDNGVAHGGGGGDLKPFERGEERVVDKLQQAVGSQRLSIPAVFCPIAPPAMLWNERCEPVFIKLPVVFFFVVYFQKQHPCNLFDTLGIAIDAGIIAHDVSDALYEIIKCHIRLCYIAIN